MYPAKREFVKLAKRGNVIPLYTELNADLETPVSAFLKIAKGDYSYLLESVEGTEKIARYSFMGSSPSLIFSSKNRNIEIIRRTNNGDKVRRYLTKTHPLDEIKKIMSRYRFVAIKGLPRFCGGLVGYIGYDMVRFFEKLPKLNRDDLNMPESRLVLMDTLAIFDHLRLKIKVLSNVFLRDASRKEAEKKYDEAVEKIEEMVKRLRAPLLQNQELNSLCSMRTPNPEPRTPKLRPKGANLKITSNLTKAEFIRGVNKAKSYIRKGDIIQAVLSQRFSIAVFREPFDIYRSLRRLNPSPYMYYLKFGKFEIIGSSPEILVRCEEGRVQVRPIAGTRPRGRNRREDSAFEKELLSDAKERAEHIMLVDLGRNDIGRVCEYGSVKMKERMIIERYSHVMHIVSDCEGKLRKDKDIYDLFRAAFPAGTVTGAPKIRAMEIIEELENLRRGPYAGAIGYFSFSGNMDTCITIRTIVAAGDKLYVQAGAGIVADSVPSAEYKETQSKARAMFEAIADAAAGK